MVREEKAHLVATVRWLDKRRHCQMALCSCFTAENLVMMISWLEKQKAHLVVAISRLEK
jgi:hypothetical protein